MLSDHSLNLFNFGPYAKYYSLVQSIFSLKKNKQTKKQVISIIFEFKVYLAIVKNFRNLLNVFLKMKAEIIAETILHGPLMQALYFSAMLATFIYIHVPV